LFSIGAGRAARYGGALIDQRQTLDAKGVDKDQSIRPEYEILLREAATGLCRASRRGSYIIRLFDIGRAWFLRDPILQGRVSR
jgi:hypothetical protein